MARVKNKSAYGGALEKVLASAARHLRWRVL